MNLLRKELQGLNEALYKALERSWEIAWNEWLPAFDMKRDSFNSYPHLRNLENYLDQILFYSIDVKPPQLRIKLSAPELYLLLSGVLFHDIGKIRVLKTKEEEEIEHADISRKIIVKHWSSLGIISYEMAVSLGKICAYHDLEEKKRNILEMELHTAFIDPFGQVREHSIASLLLLADHLDGAYTRVLPYYLRSLDELEIPGLFRKIVRGVFADHQAQMIRTVLSSEGSERIPHEFDLQNLKFETADKKIDKWKNFLEKVCADTKHNKLKKKIDKSFQNQQYTKINNNAEFLNCLLQYISGEIRSLQPDMKFNLPKNTADLPAVLLKCFPLLIKYCDDKHIFTPLIILLFFKFLNVDKEVNKQVTRKWPSPILLVTLLRDIRDNAAALRIIKNNLIALGIPLQAWVIDYNEHLYNIFGMETFEPVFHREYLREVAKAMWRLSTRIFGKSFFSYENLADEVREANINRIKMAVRRLSIIINDKSSELRNHQGGTILAGDFNWKWIVSYQQQEPHGGYNCQTVFLDEIIEEINTLGDPDIRL